MVLSGLLGLYLPWNPRFLQHLQGNFSLFPDGIKELKVYYIQARASFEASWTTLPMEKDYFRMPSYGYRTRLTRFAETRPSGLRPPEDDWKSLTEWVRSRYKQLHPSSPEPAEIRVVQALYEVGRGRESGAWSKPPLESYPPRAITVLYNERS